MKISLPLKYLTGNKAAIPNQIGTNSERVFYIVDTFAAIYIQYYMSTRMPLL